MPKSIRVIAVLLMLVLTSADVLAQKRITFRRGASAATVRGRIGPKVISNT